MAEPYQPISVNTGSSQQAIASTPNVTPALQDLMQGITSGMISLGDLQKRSANIPLETAQRNAELTDLRELRPLQRQAQVAQLENVQAKQAFEAESLPILNATKRAVLEQAHQNAVQFGVPEEILKVFYASVPNFIPWDPDKLHDKKTGQVNIPYANEMIQKAKAEATKMQMSIKFTGPVSQKTTDASGKMTEQTTIKNQLTGQDVGVPITTETKEPQPGVNVKDAKSTRYNPAKNVEEEIIQRYNPNTGELIGEAIVISENPIKLTQEQANALQFSSRMGLNNQIITDLEAGGFEPASVGTALTKFLPNLFRPEQLQSYEAAKANWVTATLRKESGAAINAKEYTQANKEYFPRAGDSPGVVAQKAALRKLAEENIRMSAGRAQGLPLPVAQPAPGVSSTSPAAGGAAPGTPDIPTVQTPAEASGLPAHIQFFKTPTGAVKVNPNFRP